MALPVRPPVAPMLARLARELPTGDLLYEPKWDGFRCLAFREGDDVALRSRNDRDLLRSFPEVAEAVRALPAACVALDGELLVTGPGGPDFPALMGRLHPSAARAAALASARPATLVAFDLLALGSEDLRPRPLHERRGRLEAVLAGGRGRVALTPATPSAGEAEGWLERRVPGVDGVVCKLRGLPYREGERAMVKVKRERTAECVVAGLRVRGGSPPELASLLLGLHDDAGDLRHVGVAASFGRRRGRELMEELMPLAVPLAGHPWQRGYLLEGGPTGRLRGAAGRWDPSTMPLDWVPLAPVRVCEVAYDQLDGHRLRHPARWLRWRPDREPSSCGLEQLDAP